MTEPKPEYKSTSTTVPGLDLAVADLVTLPADDVARLRRAAIDIVRICDLAKYGRDDKTIPTRRR